MPDLDRAFDAYRDAEPRRVRDPFSDRALRDSLAAVGAAREGRRGVRGWVASWFAAVPGRAVASGALSLAIVCVGLSGMTTGTVGGAPNGAPFDASDNAAVKSSEMVQDPHAAATAPGVEPIEATPAGGGAAAGLNDATMLVVVGIAGLLGSLISAEYVRRRRRG